MFSTNFSGQLLAAGDQLALERRGLVVGGQHEHGPDRIIGLRGQLHTSHCRTPVGDGGSGRCRGDTIGAMATPVNSGLEGVVAAETSIALVDGQAGRLLYRGYEIGDLAAHGSYDRVVGLLLDGEWPAQETPAAARGAVAHRAGRAAGTAHVVRAAGRAAHRLLGVRRGAADGLAARSRPGARADRARARPWSAASPGCATAGAGRPGASRRPPRHRRPAAARDHRRGARAGAGACAGRLLHRLRRARPERLHLHRPRDHVHPVRPGQRASAARSARSRAGCMAAPPARCATS